MSTNCLRRFYQETHTRGCKAPPSFVSCNHDHTPRPRPLVVFCLNQLFSCPSPSRTNLRVQRGRAHLLPRPPSGIGHRGAAGVRVARLRRHRMVDAQLHRMDHHRRQRRRRRLLPARHERWRWISSLECQPRHQRHQRPRVPCSARAAPSVYLQPQPGMHLFLRHVQRRIHELFTGLQQSRNVSGGGIRDRLHGGIRLRQLQSGRDRPGHSPARHGRQRRELHERRWRRLGR